MSTDSKTMISLAQASQNFPQAAQLAEENGTVYVLRNNKPMLKISFIPPEAITLSNEELLALSARLAQKSRKGYEVLAHE